jgi:type I restriction enzyme R subunit
MSRSRRERETQLRVIDLFTQVSRPDWLGYHFLGTRHDRTDNRCIDEILLRASLKARGYSDAHISAALQKLLVAIDTRQVSLYQASLRTYNLLRYGVPVQVAAGRPHETVQLIDWVHPERNDFALAEEVTLKGGHQRRPDLVVYVNGIALVVIELKRGSVEVADGIRQLITNQEQIFNQAFFPTVQLLLAGNDAQGLRYGSVTAREEFFVEWKVAPLPDDVPIPAGALLDRPLAELCDRARLLDLIYNCVVFDDGIKKVPRQHQYFAIKAAQARVRQREGGVIWHTQGSGKSILMVLLVKWLLEHDPEARVLVVTDRDELDKQIEGVMKNAGVVGEDAPSPRITRRAEFVARLGEPSPRLLCALIHKFDVTDLKGPAPAIHGRFYVFVDECHRTQGGRMNQQMKRWLQGAVFIGFTGTPLLKKDEKKLRTREVFGSFIHTYKFHEAVADNVVLDLKYEARDVPQRITSPKAIEAYFERRTRGLNGYQKAILRKRWATMEELMSAGERKQRILHSILEDFDLKPRLNNDRGTAILVAPSIYDACHYFRLLQNTRLSQNCGIVTSYEPNHNAISREPADSDERYKYDTYTQYVLDDKQTTKAYEDDVKRRFIKEPANMKLLVVVSKLLTGFDAPSCTYIYLDNSLSDHNLFQAICRTNRLDGEDKEYGHIVDFKELFKDVQEAIAIYSSDELDIEQGDAASNNVEIKDWLKEGRRRLEEVREALCFLCEPVPPPAEMEQFLHFFCGRTHDPESLLETEPLRIAYYKAVADLLRAYSEVIHELEAAGYSEAEAVSVKREVEFHADMRSAIKKHSGEELDLKPYEAGMRHLLNTYVQADPADSIGSLGALPLTELIVKTGIHDAIAQRLNAKGRLSRDAIAEAIVHNIRKTIIREQLTDPRFYEQMSKLLEDLVRQSRDDAAAYEEFLKNAEQLVFRLQRKDAEDDLPEPLRHRPEATVIYRNLPGVLSAPGGIDAVIEQRASYGEGLVSLAVEIDDAMRHQAPADWRGDPVKETIVKNVLFPLMGRSREATEALFDLIKAQQGYP